MAVGRITGPLLASNLLRDGVNLAVETNLLYLDVVDGRIGIKTASPQYELDVNGTIHSLKLKRVRLNNPIGYGWYRCITMNPFQSIQNG